MANELYCSLDLELTGFDPTKDTILEVGFVFFRPTETGLEITEQWTQTFRPLSLVHPKILGLTGLTQEELDASPSFAEHRDFLQEKLRDVILVGHNIPFDAGFLEAFGIKLSGRMIDTLDLVQFLLPTHHSYNLENLMHFFSIPHLEAHRALADSIASVQVLERLIGLYNGLSSELKNKIVELGKRADFSWSDLFVAAPGIKAQIITEPGPNFAIAPEATPLEPNKIRLLPFGTDTLPIPHKDNSKHLIALNDKNKVLDLWKSNTARGIFPPQDLFNSEKFEMFLSRADLMPDEIKFALKILVWQETNWQNETILDLNLTFFGGQFRNYISPAPIKESYEEEILATDFSSLPYITAHVKVDDRELLLSSVHEFERDLASGKERRISWQRFLYVFRSLEWNEANEGGVPREIIAEAVTATDLFFGLVNITVQRSFSQYTYLSLTDLANDERADRRIRDAAENYIEKVKKIFSGHEIQEVSRLLEKLQKFFADDPNQIKWIETTQTNCTLFNQPLHVLEESKSIISKFGSVAANEDFAEPVLNYLLARLGLNEMKLEQGSAGRGNKIRLETIEIKDNKLAEILTGENLPAAVIMGSLQEIKEFYNANYDALKKYASLYAQGYSGGSNKIIRNFGIKPESILFATGNLLLTQDSRRLKPKTLVITEFPRENLNHPYVKALREYWEPYFPNIGAVLNAYLLFRMLKTCLHDGLETIYVNVPRSDTDRFLHETLQKLPIVITK